MSAQSDADIIVVGGGPAGVSAALTARNRAKNVLVIAGNPAHSGLHRAERVDNYPGLPGISGAGLAASFRAHAESAGAAFLNGMATGVSKTRTGFLTSCGSEVYQSRAVIIAVGVVQKSAFPGERELLGRGVSYCATCDGMLFRNKKIAVVATVQEAAAEAGFLAKLGCEVTFFAAAKNLEAPAGIPLVLASKYEILGGDRVSGLLADGREYGCDGVFIIRSAIAPSALLPDIETENGHVKIGGGMETSVPGVFAAGDCAGPPYQAVRAAGQGCAAALSACEYLDKTEK